MKVLYLKERINGMDDSTFKELTGLDKSDANTKKMTIELISARKLAKQVNLQTWADR